MEETKVEDDEKGGRRRMRKQGGREKGKGEDNVEEDTE